MVLSLKNRQYEWVVEGSKADAARFEAQKRIELTANVHETRVAPKFSDLCVEKYRPYAKANFTKSTWRARSNILVSLQLFFRQKKLTEFTASDVEAYKAHRLEASKLSPSSMNTELRALQRVLRWATKNGYPVSMPSVTFLKEPAGRVRIWTHEELDRLMSAAAAAHPEILRVIVFLLNTGCRKGEARAAEWTWIDFNKGMIRMPASEHWKPKNGRAREIPISDACLAVLTGPRRSERWVFPNRDGAMFERFPDAIFKELQTKAKISGGAHTLRHSFASSFLQKKPSMFLLGQILGHSTQRMTEIYSHLLPDHLEEARNAVNIGPPQRLAQPLASTKKKRQKKA